jgi:hypothetical protein
VKADSRGAHTDTTKPVRPARRGTAGRTGGRLSYANSERRGREGEGVDRNSKTEGEERCGVSITAEWSHSLTHTHTHTHAVQPLALDMTGRVGAARNGGDGDDVEVHARPPPRIRAGITVTPAQPQAQAQAQAQAQSQSQDQTQSGSPTSSEAGYLSAQRGPRGELTSCSTSCSVDHHPAHNAQCSSKHDSVQVQVSSHKRAAAGAVRTGACDAHRRRERACKQSHSTQTDRQRPTG